MRRRKPGLKRLEIYRTKLNRLHNAIHQSHQSYDKLFEKSGELKERVGHESVHFETADHVKGEQAKIVKRLGEVAKKAREEHYVLNEKEQTLLEKVGW
jgi:hypothetical protein